MKKLSSDMTWIMKYGFGCLWVGGFGLGTLSTFVFSGLDTQGAEIGEFKWMFLLIWIVATAVIYWAVARLKNVHLEGHEFVISSLREEIRINVGDVKKVTGSIMFSPELAWLHLETDTKFGNKIQFMPPIRFLSIGFTRHPLVKELDELVKSASMR